MVNVCIFSIVISKLGYGQEPSSIILLKINKGSKISLYSAILLLRLAVDLQIKGGEKFLFNVKKIIKQRSEFQSEN